MNVVVLKVGEFEKLLSADSPSAESATTLEQKIESEINVWISAESVRD